MKKLFLSVLFSNVLIVQTLIARTVEVEVYGMTCAFCVDSLERTFEKMHSISKVKVSLKQKLVQLETDDTLPSIETIRNAILDAGFTPIKVTVLPDENKQK
ncbi:MAG: hypothetical protein COA99_10260 [Moraxellaceae bacterium]|nr:MAG: hypothetical protein COA99_10260 [Moraxellaceae bacterium]